MLELYQSEACRECAAVRRRFAALKIPYVVRTVPMSRARRERVVEAGGRPDIPLLLDPERGRTTYEVDEILAQLGSQDLFGVDAEADPDLAQLFQAEGDPASEEARRVLDAAGLDYVCRPAPAPDAPRLVEPGGAARVGARAIEDWARGFQLRGEAGKS